MKKLILVLLLVLLSFAEEWEYTGILKGRIISWSEPATNWTWCRSIYYSTQKGIWRPFKNCDWYATHVKINDWFHLDREFKIVLSKPPCKE